MLAARPTDPYVRNAVIRKGGWVYIYPWVLHRDPRFFPEPERFDPERFARGRVESIPQHAYIPFGAGPHVCIGNTFAQMEVVLAVSTVIRRFRLVLPDGARPVEIEPQRGDPATRRFDDARGVVEPPPGDGRRGRWRMTAYGARSKREAIAVGDSGEIKLKRRSGGTWVHDADTKEEYLLRANGKRPVLPGEFNGRNYDELLRSEPTEPRIKPPAKRRAEQPNPA